MLCSTIALSIQSVEDVVLENGLDCWSRLFAFPGVPAMPPVTEYRVLIMITEALREYDTKQEQRHRDNTTRLDALKEAVDESHGVKKLVAWGIPIIISVLSIIAEILRHR